MTTDVHTLSGAYALDALSEVEAAEFRQHLAGCQACRDEVRELRHAAARMGAATPVAPPPALRSRVLAMADRTPQVPPVLDSAEPAPGTPAPDVPVADGFRTDGRDDTRRLDGGVRSIDSAPSRRPRWQTWLAGAAAALVLVGGGAIGARAMLDDGRDSGLSAAAASVFEADDTRTATLDTDNGGQITVGISPSLREMAVDTTDLPALDSDHVYQVWSVHDGRMTSAALLGDLASGAAMGLPPENAQVALTVEPKGGSEQPTTTPIVTLDPAQI